MLEFLDDRVHCTQFGGIISVERRINASIVQGSGIGPVSYVICASDLRALHTGNAFDKYADDSYLIVPSINSSTIPDEFRHISDWASANNLKLNTNKTKEMIFHRPRVNSQTFPPPLDGITRVTTMNVLGVHIQSNLSFRDQVDRLFRQSAQTMYALRILRHHGLCGPPLWEVAGATLMSRLTYASSAWWGFIDAEGRKRLNSVVTKATKYGYLPPSQPSFDDICMRIDLKFFRSVLSNPHHELHQLLPPVRQNHHNLRPRAHDRSIPDIKDSVFRKTFIIRMIFLNSYWHLSTLFYLTRTLLYIFNNFPSLLGVNSFQMCLFTNYKT